MKEGIKNGFSLIELIIVIAIVAIVGTPIVEGIVNSIRLNARSQAVKDAAILAQKYSETIETQGVGATGLVLGTNNDVVVNGFHYIVTCSEDLSKRLTIDTAEHVPEGYKEYYRFDSSSSSGELNITKEEIQADGFANILETLPELDAVGDNYSLIFCNESGDNKIKIYRNDYQYNSDLDDIVKREFGAYISEIVTDWRSIRVVNNDAARTVNVNVYNTLGDNVNVFYNSSQQINVNFKYDTNVFLHDISDLGAVTFNADRESHTYFIQIRRQNDTDPLISRFVTHIE